jgi:transcriptional regulator with XRE-family HTH domain/tetratricopeptide (TPR) repeat protein
MPVLLHCPGRIDLECKKIIIYHLSFIEDGPACVKMILFSPSLPWISSCRLIDKTLDKSFLAGYTICKHAKLCSGSSMKTWEREGERMKRKPLRMARLHKGWTIEQAAEELKVGRSTILRWELGTSRPFPHNIETLCQTYGASAEELGLEEPDSYATAQPARPQEQPEEAAGLLAAVAGQHLEARLHCVIYDWLYYRRPSWLLTKLQQRLSCEVESYDTMKQQDPPNHPGIDEGRRAALRTLALIPVQALGLGAIASGMQLSWKAPEVLTHCAAGITACYHLAKGQHEDIALASEAISAYLPALQKIVRESSLSRQEAAHLVAQCFLLKATLAMHYEGMQQAIADARQALIYAETSGDLPLQLVILHRQIWIAICSRQPAQALTAALQIQTLLEHPTVSLPPLILSSAYAGIAKGQAVNRRHLEAQAALSQMYDIDTRIEGENFIYAEHSGAAKNAGQIHFYLGQYDKAFDAFSKVVDPQMLTLGLPVSSERNRIQIINYMALSALKRPNKDKELIVPLWIAGMQGARNLRSEQRYEEALTAYGIMEALWSDDAQIRDLRDLVGHW